MAGKSQAPKPLYLKIGEACKELDIQPYVLRYWETEFPALNPNKSRSGQRVYGKKELATIRRIKELLYAEGYTIAGAKKKLEAELASGTLGKSPKGKPAAAPAPDADAAAAVVALDTESAEAIKTLRRGIEGALTQAREILELLA